MKGEYAKHDLNHHNSNTNMFAKLHQTQKFHHQNHLRHPPSPPPNPQLEAGPAAFHHPFPAEYQTSEEADSPTTTTKKESAAAGTATTNDGGTVEVVRRPRGRPPGSRNKPKPPVIITRDAEPSMNPYILEIPSGVDIIGSVKRFCRSRNIGLCILNASGAVANVTLRQPAQPPGPTITLRGCSDILSLSATILSPDNNNYTHRHAQLRDDDNDDVIGLTISLAGPHGQVYGSTVTGALTSAGVVYLTAATFNSPCYQRLPLMEEGERSNNASNSSLRGGGNIAGRHSPPSGGGVDGGHPPAAAVYSSHLPSDVIWAPTTRPPPPY